MKPWFLALSDRTRTAAGLPEGGTMGDRYDTRRYSPSFRWLEDAQKARLIAQDAPRAQALPLSPDNETRSSNAISHGRVCMGRLGKLRTHSTAALQP